MNNMEDKYIIVTWPDIQFYMDKYGFEDNAYLINDDKGIEEFGGSAYFINEKWFNRKKSETI